MTDTELKYAIVKGDRQTFRLVFELYKDKVFNLSISFLKSTEAAEEITQDVFVEVFQSISSFNENARLSTWIHRIAVNKCLDFIRYQKRQKRFTIVSSLFDMVTGRPLREPADFIHPGVTLENRELSAYLFRAISRLPERQKTAFILFHLEGVRQQEIAEIMELSVKGIESLLHRAKGNLRGYLRNVYNAEYREGLL
jgi:RNA polymerase sigma-70 factor (ECF subfamily)